MSKRYRFSLRCRVLLCGAAALSLLVSLSPGATGLRQDAAPEAETYRLRVENSLYGRIEMSADGGETYILVGRVLRPASKPSLDKTAATPGIVLRGNGYGLAFSLAPNEALKLRPLTPNRKPGLSSDEPASLLTNLEPKQGLFENLMPPYRCPVRLQVTPRSLIPLPANYTLSEGDVFVFLVKLPPPPMDPPPATEAQKLADWQAIARQRIETLGKRYAEGAVARARAEKRRVVSGTLTLRAKLPEGEPEPIKAVTYMVDGNLVALQNTPPYSYDWDTRQASDGEHVVAIIALNGRGGRISRAHALVVVQNAK